MSIGEERPNQVGRVRPRPLLHLVHPPDRRPGPAPARVRSWETPRTLPDRPGARNNMLPNEYKVLDGVANNRIASWFERPEIVATTEALVVWGYIEKVDLHKPDTGAEPRHYRFTKKGAALRATQTRGKPRRPYRSQESGGRGHRTTRPVLKHAHSATRHSRPSVTLKPWRSAVQRAAPRIGCPSCARASLRAAASARHLSG